MGMNLVSPHSGPFVTAGMLRSRFSSNWKKDRGINPSNWKKDRGTNPDGSERLDDVHDGPVGCRT
jgi:hypothetical protein